MLTKEKILMNDFSASQNLWCHYSKELLKFSLILHSGRSFGVKIRLAQLSSVEKFYNLSQFVRLLFNERLNNELYIECTTLLEGTKLTYSKLRYALLYARLWLSVCTQRGLDGIFTGLTRWRTAWLKYQAFVCSMTREGITHRFLSEPQPPQLPAMHSYAPYVFIARCSSCRFVSRVASHLI